MNVYSNSASVKLLLVGDLLEDVSLLKLLLNEIPDSKTDDDDDCKSCDPFSTELKGDIDGYFELSL